MVTILKKGMTKEALKERLEHAMQSDEGNEIRKYAGTITPTVDPKEHQRQMRDEWE